MSRAAEGWLVVVLAGAGTFAIRFSFLAVAQRARDLPTGLLRVLSMIPPAALAALVATGVAVDSGTVEIDPARVTAAVLAGAAAWRTRSIAAAVVVGMPALMVLDALR